MEEATARNNDVGKTEYRYNDNVKPTREMLDELRYRLNLCNMYMIFNFCSCAGITTKLSGKYPRYDSMNYLEMKKKNASASAIVERCANMRDVVRLAGDCSASAIRFAIDDLIGHLKADGYKL